MSDNKIFLAFVALILIFAGTAFGPTKEQIENCVNKTNYTETRCKFELSR